MGNESFIWSWLTYDWLDKNIGIIILVLVVTVIILFCFPIVLGYDFKKEADKKSNKDKLNE